MEERNKVLGEITSNKRERRSQAKPIRPVAERDSSPLTDCVGNNFGCDSKLLFTEAVKSWHHHEAARG